MTKSEKIVAVRRCVGMSQSAFALKLGYSGAQISRFESGRFPVKEEVLQTICKVFGVSSEWMFGDTGELTLNYNGNDVSERLVALRNEMGLSQVEFASMIDCPQSMISRLECGKNNLSSATARKIADKCHVGIDWLLYGDEKKKRFPIDDEMLDFLWKHQDVRKKLYEIKNK